MHRGVNCVTVQKGGETFKWHLLNRVASFLESNLDDNLAFTKYMYICVCMYVCMYLWKVTYPKLNEMIFITAQSLENRWLTMD